MLGALRIDGEANFARGQSAVKHRGGGGSHEFQKLINEKEITHEMVPIGDHKSLGIVDRFARTLKTKLTKIFIARKDTNWRDYIDKVVEKYNNTEHSGIGDIKPNDATAPYYMHLLDNKQKSF
jgi:hypothetical protein